jgi:hypothetical protein
MNKSTRKIIAFFEAIEWMFGLNIYTRSIINVRDDLDISDTTQACARIYFDNTYKTIEIKLFSLFYKQSLEMQRKTLLHELCHTITSDSLLCMEHLHKGKLYTPEQINRINEKETSIIENLLDRLLCNNLKYAKKAYREYLKKRNK